MLKQAEKVNYYPQHKNKKTFRYFYVSNIINFEPKNLPSVLKLNRLRVPGKGLHGNISKQHKSGNLTKSVPLLFLMKKNSTSVSN